MPDLSHYYKILGIKAGTSQAEVKQAYRRLAKLWHPDRFSHDLALKQQAEEKLKAINEAYQYLKDYQPSIPAATSPPDTTQQSAQASVSTKLTGAEKCYERAAEYGRAGQYKEALEELSMAIRLNPDYVQAYRYRGFVHSMLGFELGAEADLRKARDLEWEQAYAARKAKRQAEEAARQRSTAQSQSARSPRSASPSSNPPQPNPHWLHLQTLIGHQGGVTAIALSGDGRLLASGSRDCTIKLWNLRTGQVFCTLSGHTAPITAIALSADANLLISGSEDQTLRFWRIKTGTLLRTLSGYKAVFTTLALSADRQLLVAGGQTGRVHFWLLNSNPITHGVYDQEDPVLSVALSRDGQQVLTGSNHHVITMYQGRTGELLRTWAAHSTVSTAIALHPTNQSFAVGGEDGIIQCWADQTTQSDRSSRLLTGHQGAITSLTFTPDGRYLISGSRDRTVRIWNSGTWELLAILTGHTQAVTSVASSQNGQWIVSSSLDHTIRLWRQEQPRS